MDAVAIFGFGAEWLIGAQTLVITVSALSEGSSSFGRKLEIAISLEISLGQTDHDSAGWSDYMFSAVPSENAKRLELFRLALVLINRGTQEVPIPLSTHFNCVLQQARLLLRDPKAISPEVIPQAVQLANDFRSIIGLKDALEGVERISDVSPDIADKVLRSLEPNIASAD